MCNNQQLLDVMQRCGQRSAQRESLTDYIVKITDILYSALGLANVNLLLVDSKGDKLQPLFLSDHVHSSQNTPPFLVNQQSEIGQSLMLLDRDIAYWMLRENRHCAVKNTAQLMDISSLASTDSMLRLPQQLIGCLLKVQERVVGVLLIKSYQQLARYDQYFKILQRVSYFLSLKIVANQREVELQAFKDMQRRDLQAQLHQSAKAEKLQRALYEVAALSAKRLKLDDFYHKIHQILNTLIDARNIGIISYDEESDTFSYGYVRSCKEEDYLDDSELTMGPGFSSYVIRERTAVLLTPQIVNKMQVQGKITGLIGNQDYCYWMGAPLIFDGTIYGTVTLQSYDEEIIYSENDLQLLQFLANHVACALAINHKQQLQDQEQERLIAQQSLLEEQNAQINQTLANLSLTEQTLIKKEKINSLGELVNDVASELMQPIKDCRSVFAKYNLKNNELQAQFDSKTLSESSLKENLAEALVAEQTLVQTMKSAAGLINRLKQISVEENASDISKINLLDYLNRLYLNLKGQLKAHNISIQLACDQQIAITTNARVLSRVLKYLIDNSICHAFTETQDKIIQIIFSLENNQILLTYTDNGVGMSKAALEKLFMPFYSTNHVPGSGLGCSCIYNLVSSTLHGTISVTSPEGSGVFYQIAFPNLTAAKVGGSGND